MPLVQPLPANDRGWITLALLANLALRERVDVSARTDGARRATIIVDFADRDALDAALRAMDDLGGGFVAAELMMGMWAERAMAWQDAGHYVATPNAAATEPLCPTCGEPPGRPCVPVRSGERDPGAWVHPERGGDVASLADLSSALSIAVGVIKGRIRLTDTPTAGDPVINQMVANLARGVVSMARSSLRAMRDDQIAKLVVQTETALEARARPGTVAELAERLDVQLPRRSRAPFDAIDNRAAIESVRRGEVTDEVAERFRSLFDLDGPASDLIDAIALVAFRADPNIDRCEAAFRRTRSNPQILLFVTTSRRHRTAALRDRALAAARTVVPDSIELACEWRTTGGVDGVAAPPPVSRANERDEQLERYRALLGSGPVSTPSSTPRHPDWSPGSMDAMREMSRRIRDLSFIDECDVRWIVPDEEMMPAIGDRQRVAMPRMSYYNVEATVRVSAFDLDQIASRQVAIDAALGAARATIREAVAPMIGSEHIEIGLRPAPLTFGEP